MFIVNRSFQCVRAAYPVRFVEPTMTTLRALPVCENRKNFMCWLPSGRFNRHAPVQIFTKLGYGQGCANFSGSRGWQPSSKCGSMLVPNMRRIDRVCPDVQLSLSTSWMATLRLQASISALVTSGRSREYVAMRISECFGAWLMARRTCTIVRSWDSSEPIGLLNIGPVSGSHACAETVPPPSSTTVASTTTKNFLSTSPIPVAAGRPRVDAARHSDKVKGRGVRTSGKRQRTG